MATTEALLWDARVPRWRAVRAGAESAAWRRVDVPRSALQVLTELIAGLEPTVTALDCWIADAVGCTRGGGEGVGRADDAPLAGGSRAAVRAHEPASAEGARHRARPDLEAHGPGVCRGCGWMGLAMTRARAVRSEDKAVPRALQCPVSHSPACVNPVHYARGLWCAGCVPALAPAAVSAPVLARVAQARVAARVSALALAPSGDELDDLSAASGLLDLRRSDAGSR